MHPLDRDLIRVKVGLTRSQKSRVEHHSKRVGCDMSDLMRDAIAEKLDFLDEKEEEAKRKKGRGIAFVPDHAKPQGLGPTRSEAKKASAETEPPPSPFAALLPPAFIVPDKVKKAFRGWAEYLEEADGIVESERRARKIVDDIKTRVDEKSVQPCYEAFVEFCTERKDAKEKPMISVEGVPLVGDV